MSDLELFINDQYTQAIEAMRKGVAQETHDVGNSIFRVLQILEHLR
jgi:hypothetical protein